MNDSECKRANPPEEDAASIATSVSEETAPPADTLPSILHSVDTEPTCIPAADHQVVPCALPSPPARGRDCRRYRRRSPCSDSSSSSSSSPSSSSCSPSPKRQIYYFKSQCVGSSFGTCTCVIFLSSIWQAAAQTLREQFLFVFPLSLRVSVPPAELQVVLLQKEMQQVQVPLPVLVLLQISIAAYQQ